MSEADRLQLALKVLRPAEWEAFERLCSAFLCEDFPSLRTVAGVGDEGRDAILADPAHAGVIVQYSIAADWAAKIRSTLARLDEAGHPCSVLVYATNHDVGAQGDAIKSELMRRRVLLDIRDRSYFVDRVYQSPSRTAAAEDLAERCVDPLLPSEAITRNSGIGNPDLRAGLLYLELHAGDPEQSRNISRVSIEALVLAALRETSADSQMSRAEVVASVGRAVPGRDLAQLAEAVDGALGRLRSQKRVVYSGKDDTFALQFSERERRDARALAVLARREAVRKELAGLTRRAADVLEIPVVADTLDPFLDTLEALFERILEERGNEFAEAVRTHMSRPLRTDVHRAAGNTVTLFAAKLKSMRVGHDPLVELAAEVVAGAFVMPSESLQQYLRELADAYTWLAFMQQAPDVQRAVSHFFSRGHLIIDTTALLPCFAEDLLPALDQRYTNLLRGAHAAGMELYVTEGVINEIASHLQLSLLYHRIRDEWIGPVPRVYADWESITGGGDFPAFVRRFLGGSAEEDDIEFFLREALGIAFVDLEQDTERFTQAERAQVTEIWRPKKRIRPTGDEMERDILLRHDIEMFFGALAWRRREKKDVFGYESWWLTSDGTALRMFDLARKDGLALPSNPCMTPTFLTNLLSVGPSRSQMRASVRGQLPVALDVQRYGQELSGLLSHKADEIRAEHQNDPVWRLRKRARDQLNVIKSSQGSVGGPLAGYVESVYEIGDDLMLGEVFEAKTPKEPADSRED
jgi:hypothetical protein